MLERKINAEDGSKSWSSDRACVIKLPSAYNGDILLFSRKSSLLKHLNIRPPVAQDVSLVALYVPMRRPVHPARVRFKRFSFWFSDLFFFSWLYPSVSLSCPLALPQSLYKHTRFHIFVWVVYKYVKTHSQKQYQHSLP